MSDTFISITQGSGTKLHTFDRSIGGNTVHDEVILHGEPYLATYVIAPAASVSIATANDHVCQVMAGASLNVVIRRIRVYQTVPTSSATFSQLALFRLTSAGTGGTAITPAPLDSADAASGATAMTLPSAKGAEGVQVGRQAMGITQTQPVAGIGPVLVEWDFERFRTKGLRIASGTSNGIAIKSLTAAAAASVQFEILISELNFT